MGKSGGKAGNKKSGQVAKPKVSKAKLVAKVGGAGGAATVASRKKQTQQRKPGGGGQQRKVVKTTAPGKPVTPSQPKINLGYKKIGAKIVPTAKLPTLNLGYKKVQGKLRPL